MMADLSGSFDDFGGRVWLNTAHQGALPRVAAAEAREAVSWKTVPGRLGNDRFREVPDRLRVAIGRLLNAPVEEVVLANSASYGLHVVASAYPWRSGDEVLVMEGDFPSDILPWLALEERFGVKTRRIRPREKVVQPDELAGAITSRTRLFCAPWVHSFSGCAIDLDALGAICREHGVVLLVNGSQALGARPLDVRTAPVDGLVSVGFKWLCGPYGTGLLWLRPELRDRLRRIKAYWLAAGTADDLASERSDVTLKDELCARDFDIFGTANFFNFKPFAASIEYLLELGIEKVRAHDQALVSQFVSALPSGYRLLSPGGGPSQSTLVFISHQDPRLNAEVHARLGEAGVDAALRGGAIRFSPHLYNTPADMDRALSALASCDPARRGHPC